MKSFFLIILFSLVICSGYSQQSNCVGSSEDDYGRRMQAGLIGFEYFNPIQGYQGVQYFNDWTKGEVILSNGDVIKDITLRYDKYLDALLWLRKFDIRTGIISKASISGFRLFDSKNQNKLLAFFIKKKIALSRSGSTDAFLQVLVSGEFSLYAYRNVNVISTTEYVLNDNTRYFISFSDQQYPLSLRRGSLLKIPVIKKAEMKTILRSNGIAINDEKDLISAINFYNKRKK